MATSYLEDRTKYRSNAATYTVDDTIGRRDPTYVTAVEETPTVSGITLRTNYR